MRVFEHHILAGYSGQSDEVIVLKCAITGADGIGSWCDFESDEWNDVIRPNEDEIGVFLEGYTNLPYRPGTSARQVNVASTQGTETSRAHKTHKPVDKQNHLMYLKYGNETKTVFAPSSLDALRTSAQSLFPNLDEQAHDKILISSTWNDPTTGKPVEVYMDTAAYRNLIANQKGPITLKVEQNVTSRDRHDDGWWS
ncbi:hypothetical protein BDZ97DRAFT_1838224 [Flammula alnicola]|nr:hypothetical protein BDZ97DRAFT_1838224 [Flammula alnicola]